MFEVNNYLATDYFKDSSSIPLTSRSSTDKQLHAISEKTNSLKIATQQLKLNQEVYKVGSEFQKQLQSQKLYETSEVETEISQIQFDQTVKKSEIATSKLNQLGLQLNRSNLELKFYETETELGSKFWDEKLKLIESRIELVKSSQLQIASKIENVIDV
jgi:hypothetical protein